MPRDLRLSRRFSKSGNTPAGSMRPSPTRRLLICGTITAIAQGEEPGYDDGGQGDDKYGGASGRGRGGAERGAHLGRKARVLRGRGRAYPAGAVLLVLGTDRGALRPRDRQRLEWTGGVRPLRHA